MAVKVITIQLPGAPGSAGPKGDPGPSTVLTMGTVTTVAAGGNATATLSGVSPNQTLNIGIPRGATGATGPGAALTIGTITTSTPGSNGAASITGTSPNFVLNLTLPRGYGVPAFGTASQVLIKNSSTDYDTGWLSYDAVNSASTLIVRDSAGRAQVTAPSANLDIANKAYVDALGTNANTASTIMRRDANGRAQVVDPSAAQDIASKNYVDTQVATRAATSHTHTASQISDSTTVGRSVLTATDAPAARSAIGAGTSSLVIGTTSTTAAAGDHTHSDLTNATDAPTANTLVKRDANGRFDAADPAASSDVATKNYTDTSISTHNSATTAHGATGAVVGTTNAQTLTNKTLDTPVLNSYAEWLESASPANASASGRWRVYIDSTTKAITFRDSAGLIKRSHVDWGSGTTFPTTPQRGDTFYYTTNTTFYIYDGSVWRDSFGVPSTETWHGDWSQNAQSAMATGADTPVPFQAVNVASSIVTRAANNYDFTIVPAGLYMINSMVRLFGGGAAVSEKYMGIQQVGGAYPFMSQGHQSGGNGVATLSTAFTKQLAANTTFRVIVYHNAGQSLNTDGSAFTSLRITRLR